MKNGLTNKELVNKLIAKHGIIYDYSRVNYVNSKTNIEIICKVHGSFYITTTNHLRGRGCKFCSFEKLANNRKKSTEHFISDSKKVHGELYDYLKVEYVNNIKNVVITCFNHGEFSQRPQHHLDGSGCPDCSLSKNKKRHTFEMFAGSARNIHADKYKYINIGYTTKKNKIQIECKKHGIFLQTPNCHLSGEGCPKCSHLISKPETEFLDYLNVPLRSYRLTNWKQKLVDGYDENNKTVYEFLGDYWHGNPKKFTPTDIHPRIKKSYGELYQRTFSSFEKMKSLGYTIKYIWELDWKNFKKQENSVLNVKTY